MELVFVLLIMAVVLIVSVAPLAILLARREAQRATVVARVELPVLQDPARRCGSCEFFDLEAGQARLRRQRIFANMVAPFISPSEYDVKVTEVQPNAEGVLENAAETKSEVPDNCMWHRFGACMKHNDCLWEGTTSEQRLKNMVDLTPGGVDCYEPKRNA